MTVHNFKFLIHTKGFTDIIDITPQVERMVAASKERNGIVHVFVPGSTVAVSTVEYEPGLLKDLPEALENVAPYGKAYHHDEKWQDGNGYAHIRSAIMGNAITVPLVEHAMVLGQWQQIVLVDFDNKSRSREVIVQVLC
jgi:secondary thiamine-phosphate synthase enzyme